MLSSEVSNVLSLYEVKGEKAFSSIGAQALLLVEVIEPTLAYLLERKLFIKVVQRIFER